MTTIADPSTNRVDNSNIGRTLITDKTIDIKNGRPIVEFSIFDKSGYDNGYTLSFPRESLPNGVVTSFKRIDGMIQLPLFENQTLDPNKIQKFRLDLSQITTDRIEIECDVTRFDYYLNYGQFDKIDKILAENNNDLIDKILGFDDRCTSTSGFQYTEIVSTPKMIIARGLKAFIETFNSCGQLKLISPTLFDFCPDVNTFRGCFELCSSLTIVPETIFDSNIKASDFRTCFGGNANLRSIPTNLFDNNTNVTNLEYCFYDNTNITSSLPDVWNKNKFPNVTKGTGYARGCTKAANYAEIPDEFK